MDKKARNRFQKVDRKKYVVNLILEWLIFDKKLFVVGEQT